MSLKWYAQPPAAIATVFYFLVVINICGCSRHTSEHAPVRTNTFSALPDGTVYTSELKNYFPNESVTESNSAKIFVCGAVAKPQVLSLEREMTIGEAISLCGVKAAFAITVVRRSNENYSMMNIGLGAEMYKPTGYERIPLQKGDIIVVTKESY